MHTLSINDCNVRPSHNPGRCSYHHIAAMSFSSARRSFHIVSALHGSVFDRLKDQLQLARQCRERVSHLRLYLVQLSRICGPEVVLGKQQCDDVPQLSETEVLTNTVPTTCKEIGGQYTPLLTRYSSIHTESKRSIGGLVLNQLGPIDPALWDEVVGMDESFGGCSYMLAGNVRSEGIHCSHRCIEC